MNPSAFTNEDYADFRLNLAIKKVGQELLTNILEIAIRKPPNQTYFEYLFTDQNVPTKAFDYSQKEKLKNASGNSFDITLLFKIFVQGCPHIAPTSDANWKCPDEFEYWLKRVKDLRNDVMHSALPIPYAELNNWMDAIKSTLLELIKVSVTKFRIGDNERKEMEAKVCRNLEAILTTPLTQTEIDECLVTEGTLEAQLRYRKLSYVNPVDFFVGLQFSTQIDDVFVSLEIKELDGYEEGQNIEWKNMLKPFQEDNASLIAIEGLAGSGKTTLLKYILSRWIEGDDSMKGLKHFEIIIFLQCNNAYLNSLYDLIASIMPETARRFDRQKLIESLLCRRLLIVVDGVDEAHAGTKAILRELLNKANGKNVKFLCTSRPEKIQWLYRIKGDVKCGTYSIIGIPNERRKEFIKKLHKYYSQILNKKEVISDTRVIDMLEKLPMSIKNELRLPIFLALFTYFCTVEPEKISHLDSVFSLYNELTNALKEKLYTRSMSKSNDAIEDDDIKDEVDECFMILCKQSFVSLCQNNSNVSWTSFQTIKEKSLALGLTVKEVLSAFLVVKVVLTPRGVEETVGYPHKGLQEFLAAKAVIQRVKNGESLNDIFELNEIPAISPSSSRPRIRNLHLDTDFMKHQNLVMHLAGLVSLENMATDIIVNEIVSLYKKAGIYTFEQWLRLFARLNEHALVSEYILMKFKKATISEGNMGNFSQLLKHGCPSEIILTLGYDTKTLHKLKTLLSKLTLHECNIKLLINHHFAKPANYSSVNLMNHFAGNHSRCILTWFAGSLNENGMSSLPPTVQALRIGIGTASQAKALKILDSCSQNIHMLRVHVERHINEKDVPQMKTTYGDLILYISGLANKKEDLLWAENICLKLNPSKKYRKMMFPRSQMEKYTIVHLLKLLRKAGITVVSGIKVTTNAEGLDESDLAKNCLNTMGCKFNLVEDSEMWPV